ncbi:aminotransferase [Pueribacillus theae]|uniref:Aminotransferase n=1 Tax=Pueribacillus theae TaxID=2171751 RepID=A0A2U1K7N4_9BACI|nr:PLP-dependent aminotransferase family protein [Pueribacillus theae]PWA13234.1 aminotransferase [Pueribacillus theae]
MKYGFARRVHKLKSSAVRDLLKIINQGNIISFAGGLPDDGLFPLEAVENAFDKAFQSGKQALQYAETEGLAPFREAIAERMAKNGIKSSIDDILVTTGSQQAIDLFTRIMFDPGDVVLTENPTYLAALQVFQSYEVDVKPVLSDEQGMIPEDLDNKVKKYNPKAIYVIPTFSNPTGKAWSHERREHLLEIAKKRNVIIFEDDPYGEIKFDDNETFVPIAAMDTEGTHVLYTSTFSKTVVPALRTGWIKGPYQIIRMMAQAKQATDLHTNSLSQHALYHLLRDFDLDSHIKTLRKTYCSRMKIMKELLESINMPGFSYIVPKGGMFFWVSMPDAINVTSLLDEAVKRGVAYVPGAPFYVDKPELNTLRLNYTHSAPDKLKKGMEILTDVFSNTLTNAK